MSKDAAERNEYDEKLRIYNNARVSVVREAVLSRDSTDVCLGHPISDREPKPYNVVKCPITRSNGEALEKLWGDAWAKIQEDIRKAEKSWAKGKQKDAVEKLCLAIVLESMKPPTGNHRNMLLCSVFPALAHIVNKDSKLLSKNEKGGI